MWEIPAAVDFVGDTRMSTTLHSGDVSVSTVEHLMSAFAGLGIDNAYVDLDAGEVPIMDGSAGPFVFLIQSAGIAEQNVAKQFIRITREVEIRDGDKWAKFQSFDGFKVEFSIDFEHPILRSSSQSACVDCPSGFYTLNMDMPLCKICPKGYYAKDFNLISRVALSYSNFLL